MCTSEQAMPLKIGGVDVQIADYSLSQVGPGAEALAQWEHARRRGMKAYAKVMLNTTWECSPVPWVPVPDNAERHLANLRAAGMDGLMLTWTLGSWLGGNLALLRSDCDVLARECAGAVAAPLVRQAWREFSAAFAEFPFSAGTLYSGP